MITADLLKDLTLVSEGKSELKTEIIRHLPPVPARLSQQPKINLNIQLALLIVNACFYILDKIADYSTIMNGNILAGELKDKIFKNMADRAAPPNLKGHLSTKEYMQ